jgi:NAD(P)-dependent dehydrogenase (short-subunit alcohol dehydrogenase family)
LPTGERRVCLLTGAGGLLGSAFCRAYASEYDIVAVVGRRVPPVPSQHERFVDPLAPSAGVAENDDAVYVVRADLERAGEVDRVVDIALARFGHVDLLVNAAAYVRLHPPGLLDTDGTMADFGRHFETNVGVPLRLAGRLADEHWKDRAEANRAANRNVVNVSSLSGSRVYPGGQAVYAASKAALNHLTRHLAAEFESIGVRVNALAPNNFPGIVATEQVAAAVVRLDGETVTGKILPVDAPAG